MTPVPPAGPAWIPGDPVWCGRCTAEIRSALRQIGDLAAVLDTEADGHRSAAAGPKVSGGGGRPSPSPTADLLDEVYREMDAWRVAALDVLGQAVMRGRSAGVPALTSTLAWLVAHLHIILALPGAALGQEPGAVRFGLRVLSWRTVLEHRARAEPETRMPGRCPNPRCGRRALRLRETGRIGCTDCGKSMTRGQYERLIEQVTQP